MTAMTRRLRSQILWQARSDLRGIGFAGDQLVPLHSKGIDSAVFPCLSSAFGHSLTPITDGFVLRLRAFPYPAFGFNDPVHLLLSFCLNNHPIPVVKADGAAGLQIIDPKLRRGITLFGRAQAREAQDVSRRGDIIEDGCSMPF